jgi:L-amino acid N-acyltransferase YncA
MTSASAAIAQHFPWTASVAGRQVSFRLMKPEDGGPVLQFVRSLPEEDLFYLINDIRDPEGMKRWIAGLGDQTATTVLAEADGRLLGYGLLRGGHLRWTRHLAEVRVMVAPEFRGNGLGRLLAKEVFAVAHDVGMRRLIARLTSQQISARYLFQHLGFHIEAVLADCVIDKEGLTQDMIFMSYDVSGFHG